MQQPQRGQRTPAATRADSIVTPPPERLTNVVEQNITALIDQRRAIEERRSLEERIADAVTKFAGSMRFIYLHLTLFGLWVLINLGWLGIEPFDPSFVVLAMVASVEAIFLSTFVLITQNRMAAAAGRRADLDLQVSLLSEHEITRLIRLTSAIASRMGIEDAGSSEIEELAQDVAPVKVMQRMEEQQAEET